MDVIDGDENVLLINNNQPHGGGVSDSCSNDVVNIISKNKRCYNTLNASGLRLELKFRQPQTSDINEWLRLCIDELLSIMQCELNIQPQDRIGIMFTKTNNVRADFSTSFRPFSQYSTESILFEI